MGTTLYFGFGSVRFAAWKQNIRSCDANGLEGRANVESETGKKEIIPIAVLQD